MDNFDYVIVGAGSAGCVLANRLSANPDCNVLLLEAGEEASDPAVFHPPSWPFLSGGDHDYGYQSTPQSALGDRIIGQSRGRGVGGSSLINALGYQRGPREAYDAWAEATGDPAWGFDGLLPYFKKMETSAHGDTEWRGLDGPHRVMHVGQSPARSPFAEATQLAANEAGFQSNADINGATTLGVNWAQLAMNGMARETAASAYLDPIRGRNNLTVLTGCRVMRVAFDGRSCAGVIVETHEGEITIKPKREVLLCAGAIDSPRLLMLSGVGDAAALRLLDIDPVVDLPGVGQSLVDHPLVHGLAFEAKKGLPMSRFNHCETLVCAKSSDSQSPNLLLMMLSVAVLADGLGQTPDPGFTIIPALLDPKSRGSITLASSNPNDQPIIDPAYLSDNRDIDALAEAFAMSRKIAGQSALSEWVLREACPGDEVQSDEAITDHLRNSVSSFYHPASTCKMGRQSDGLAVVDPQCRILGLERLRVIDASIMPNLPLAMPNAGVMALSERAAQLIITGD